MTWLLLTYKLPSNPSARRVYIWRKLKKLGAIGLFDAVWILPDTARAYEQFQWLAVEIEEMGGEAMFWRANPERIGQEEDLIRRFTSQAEEAYQELLIRLDQPGSSYSALAQEFQLVKQRDYFHSKTGQEVRTRLLAHQVGEQ